MMLRSRWVLMTVLPVALTFTGCGGNNGLSPAGLDSGTPVLPNSNPDSYSSDPIPASADSGYSLLTVNPPSVDFGAVDVGVTSSPVTVTVTNEGTATSGTLTVTVSGSGIMVSGCAGFVLAKKMSCQISITVRPEVAGQISGTIEVSDSPGNSEKIAVSGGAGGGGPGGLFLSPSPLDLGAVLPGHTVTGTVTLTGTNPVGVEMVGLVINVSGAGFSRSASGTCTDRIGSQQSCTIDVSFTASATPGTAKGTLTVSLGGVTKVVAMVATVLAPAKLVMTPAIGDFAATVGVPSAPLTFYVSNAGDTVSAIPSVALSGPNKDDFSFTSDCTKAMPGGATASCQIKVVYTPKTAPANAQATLTVAEPGTGGSSVSAALIGEAQPSSPGICVAMTPCGGDVVGTWTVKSSCLKASGPADIAYMGLTCVPNVATITGSASVSGTLTLGADGKYTDNTVTTGSDSWLLDRSCTILSGTKVRCEDIGAVFSGVLSGFGYEAFTCQDAASGGGCTCQGKINQPGRMGLLYNDTMPKGKYRTASNTLTLGDALTYSYCVNGNEMTLSPVPGPEFSTPYKGTIVLQKSGG